MNLNHLVISGNLTRPVEVRGVGADKLVAKFSVAHNTRFKGSDGEMKEETTFLDCEAWDRQAETAGQYLVQGSLVIVEGQLRQDNWTDKEGQKRSKLKLRVEKLHLMPRPKDGEQRQEPAPAERAAPRRAAPAPATGGGGSGGMDDDPPFMRDDFIGA